MAKKVILQGGVDPTLLPMIDQLIDDLRRLYGYDPPDQNTVSILGNEQRRIIGEPEYERFLEVLDDKRLSLEKVMTQLSLEKEIFLRLPRALHLKSTLIQCDIFASGEGPQEAHA